MPPIESRVRNEIVSRTTATAAAAVVVAALDASEDVDGGDLGLEREVPGDDDERPELAHGLREGERDSRQERGRDVREDDAAERRQLRGAERVRRLLELGVELLEDGLDRSDDERQRHEHQREHDRGLRVGDVHPDRRGRAVQSEQGEAGDDGRQRKGQVDDRVHERLPAEVVANQDPGRDRAEHRVHHGDGDRGPNGELERSDGLGARDRVPEALRAVASRLPDEGRDRKRDHDREKGRHKAEGQDRAGPVPRSPPRAWCDGRGASL